MPKVTRSNSKGLINEAGKGAVGVVCVENVELTARANTHYDSAEGITQPANSAIKAIHVVTTTACAFSNGVFGVRVGTAATGTQLMALDANSLSGAATAFAAGKGSSTTAEVADALSAQATLVAVVGAGFSASERTIYPECVPAGGSITAGKLQAIVEFVQFS